VNARELFDVVGRLPGTRRVATGGDDVVDSVELGGIELARIESGAERRLRAGWRERQGGRQRPVLLVGDDTEAAGCVRVLGPVRPDGPVRVVGADDLLRVLERLPSESLQAVRRLEEELARLDRTAGAAPKMGQPGWFPDHDAERRDEYRRTTPGERVAEAISISRTATKIAAAVQRARER
jgi:hypothetical protein